MQLAQSPLNQTVTVAPFQGPPCRRCHSRPELVAAFELHKMRSPPSATPATVFFFISFVSTPDVADFFKTPAPVQLYAGNRGTGYTPGSALDEKRMPERIHSAHFSINTTRRRTIVRDNVPTTQPHPTLSIMSFTLSIELLSAFLPSRPSPLPLYIPRSVIYCRWQRQRRSVHFLRPSGQPES